MIDKDHEGNFGEGVLSMSYFLNWALVTQMFALEFFSHCTFMFSALFFFFKHVFILQLKKLETTGSLTGSI